ncbi:MAG: BON domain-containing protein [Bryobacterales bacterium]|nr:BON domain-containing protein [Bryobacterales bacterium]
MQRSRAQIDTGLIVLLMFVIWLVTPASGQTPSNQSGSAVTPQRRAPETSKATLQKPAPVLSDEALERAILRRFAQSAIASNGFTVSVSGGVATLGGIASVAQHKGVATRLARRAGAIRVRNQIEIAAATRDALRKARKEKIRRTKSATEALVDTRAASSPGREPRDRLRERSTGNSRINASIVTDNESTSARGASDEKRVARTKRFALKPLQTGQVRRNAARQPDGMRKY